MLKQKLVMKVSMNNEKSRSRALKIVVDVPGVVSVSLEGKEKDLVVVVGEGIDSVVLVRSLRKKVGYTELISVGPAGENTKWKDEKKPHISTTQGLPMPQPTVYYNPDPCSIL